MNKIPFLKTTYLQILNEIDKNSTPLFGKMNVQQMIEHITYSFHQACGEIDNTALYDDTATQKMYQFMMSDKPFKDNTPNPLLPDTPSATKFFDYNQSLDELKTAIQHFFEKFENNPQQKFRNPFFGDLNFHEWVHLLHKHTLHHLRQFGINIEPYQ